MLYEIDEPIRRRAKSAHELAMLNLLLPNLLIGIALLASSMAQSDSALATYKWIAIAVPLAISLLIIALTFARAAKLTGTGPWFAAVHWRGSARRYRVLLIAYAVVAVIVAASYLKLDAGPQQDPALANASPEMLAMQQAKRQGQNLGPAVMARIAVVPLLLTVMALAVLESSALYQAGRGEVPDGQAKRFPPPPDLTPSNATDGPTADG